MTLASLPSPSTSVWHLGPLPLRAYAFCILLGVVVAVFLTDRRLRARGGPRGAVIDIAVWAVPTGIVGARIYHVVTSPAAYFGEDGELLDALKIWNGGLGIWGGVAGGALGAWIACRQRGIPLRVFADCLAPGLVMAQAVGRWGNWFNNELYGGPTDLPWALRVNVMDASGQAIAELPGTYHPTFLYESAWCLAVAFFLVWAERRWRLGGGRVFALYVMAYTLGRAWIEYLRIDPATEFFGLRLNVWVSALVFLGALVYFLRHRGSGPERLVTKPDGTVRVLGADETADGTADGTPRETADRVADAPGEDEPADAAEDAGRAREAVPAGSDTGDPADADTSEPLDTKDGAKG
ncbi:MAG TPA: prolipoprotein diacylglyceryl transferase [Cryptosporangiaceae bacterium]|nr:prolipoprotein diacylglyceryl transferase [Cryptosporangiaceae bacterium]